MTDIVPHFCLLAKAAAVAARHKATQRKAVSSDAYFVRSPRDVSSPACLPLNPTLPFFFLLICTMAKPEHAWWGGGGVCVCGVGAVSPQANSAELQVNPGYNKKRGVGERPHRAEEEGRGVSVVCVCVRE